MDYEDVIILVVLILLTNEHQISILDFWLHGISFCTHEETVLDITRSHKCHGYGDLFLGIFVDNRFPLVSTLSESENRKLNNIREFIGNAFTNQTISFFVFYKISFEDELVELIEYGLRVIHSDFCSDFSNLGFS